MKKLELVNIAVDLETLSRRPTAAIIGIAAKTFSLWNNRVKQEMEFFKAIDATSCAMYGLDFDPTTVEWWSGQPQKAKEQFKFTCSIWYVLRELATFIEDAKRINEVDDVVIWCQGTDFDISILRNAFITVNNDRAERSVPWKHTNIRDARTFINVGASLIDPETDDPYSIIPPNPKWVKHDAMSDCDQLIHNVTWIDRKLHELLKCK